jgi:hypothetical protein
LPFIRDAIEHAPSELVFPRADGSMRPIHSAPEKVLRAALKRAGLVDAYDHTCRRASCRIEGKSYVERHPDDGERRCQRCNMMLWPKAIVRRMRFHDLRHTTAILLMRAGVAAHLVQRILRHRDLRTTLNIYSHLDVEDMRGALANLPAVAAPATPEPSPSEPAVMHATGTTNEIKVLAFSTRLLPGSESRISEAGPAAKSAVNPASKVERNTRFELATFALARPSRGFASACR